MNHLLIIELLGVYNYGVQRLIKIFITYVCTVQADFQFKNFLEYIL